MLICDFFLYLKNLHATNNLKLLYLKKTVLDEHEKMALQDTQYSTYILPFYKKIFVPTVAENYDWDGW